MQEPPRTFTPGPDSDNAGMTLIIRDALVNPPTWFTSFRDLTLFCSVMLKLDIVIESEEVDLYHKWIRGRGGMDFLRDFVRPGSEPGLHLDIARVFPLTIVTDRIVPENTHTLISRIQANSGTRDRWPRPDGR